LCTRCTGQYVGLIAYALCITQTAVEHLPISLIWLLPLPITIDWVTQTLNKRVSTKSLRLLTGFLFGIWVGELVATILSRDFSSIMKVGVQITTYLVVVMSILFIHQGSIDNYLKPYEDFIEDYQKQNMKD